jgi:Ca2+-transporting ATPase
VSRLLAVAAIGICVAVFGVGVLRGQPPLLMLMTAISLAVAAIPEAMPAIVTVLLAVGARKMASAQALIRRLSAVETLGSVTYICTDKTGTLTENRMTVVDVLSADLPSMLTAMGLCNDADITAEAGAQGEPTEVALAAYARDNGYLRHALETAAPRTATFAFTSVRKRMTTVHQAAGVAYLKGAPEVLLRHAPEMRSAAQAMARSGLRVIAFARRPARGCNDDDAISADLEVLGCAGLMDPPRAESAPAIAACHTAGITTVMITGDHADTAEAIARQIGIVAEGDTEPVLTGQALTAMDDAALAECVLRTRVYARVDPAQKIRIVAALQGRGQFVAMTGDGVNDAPALSRADIGVAMGRNGTDVARESADLVLLDDNFATIVAAVREGRRIYDNIRKFIRYVLACNLAEVLVVFLAPLLGLPLPLLPVQLLWINLLTDGVPGLALAAEPAEADIMQRPPQPPAEGLFTRSMWMNIGVMGCVMAAVTIGVQYFAAFTGRQNDQTMVFTVLTLLQVGQAIAVRSHTVSVFAMPFFGNVPLLLALVATIALQMAAVYLPVANRLLHTNPLTLVDLGVCLAASAMGVVVSEGLKLRRRAHLRRR